MNALVRLVFKTANVRIDFDRDYGCENKTGWSVALGGSYVVQLEPRLWRALWKAWCYAHTSNAELTGTLPQKQKGGSNGRKRGIINRKPSAMCPS